MDGMLLELISEISGRNYPLQPDVLGKVLSLARQEGWQADRVVEQGVADNRDTAIVLPHFGAYMPSRVSRADADALRIALTRPWPPAPWRRTERTRPARIPCFK